MLFVLDLFRYNINICLLKKIQMCICLAESWKKINFVRKVKFLEKEQMFITKLLFLSDLQPSIISFGAECISNRVSSW